VNAVTTVAERDVERLDVDLVRQARARVGTEGIHLIDALQESSGLEPDRLAVALAGTLGWRSLAMADLHGMAPRFDLLPFAEAIKRECLALSAVNAGLTLVMADPFDAASRAWIEERIEEPFVWALAHRANVLAYLNRYEDGVRAMDSVAAPQDEGGAGTRVEDLSLRTISDDASPVVKLVNSTLYDALRLGVSDVHVETGSEGLNIKYRLDGVLSVAGRAAGGSFAEQVSSRIKVMAELDIAERRVPQDGRFKVAAQGREIDVRVSIMPSIHGEDAVLRILDKQALADEVRGLRLDTLGFDAAALEAIRHLAAQPYGMLLVTGPTGSGKTTTLYAALSEINHGLDKIVTIEDPVEYQLPGVLQIPVNEKKGLTFARGLRSILRHDPDKVMVGEIRDSDTAQIAVQAALTGHLVFTTVHANNVFDVIGRFNHMAVDPHGFMSALNGIVAQRLMRMSCTHCAEPVAAGPEQARALGVGIEEAMRMTLRAGRGCGHCRGTGYRGRKAIAEVLIVDDEMRELLAGRESPRRVKAAAAAKGFRALRTVAMDVVARGETSIEELNRVTLAA